MRNARLRLRKKAQFLVVKVDSVRIEHVGTHEIDALHIRQRAHAERFYGKALLVLCFAEVRMEPHVVVSRQLGALLHECSRNGKRRAGSENHLTHGKRASVVIGFDCGLTVFEDFVRGLHNGIRRQSPVLAGKAHAPAGRNHADAERFRCAKLRAEEIARAVGKDVVVVKAGRAAVFHEFRHAAERTQANGVLVEFAQIS